MPTYVGRPTPDQAMAEAVDGLTAAKNDRWVELELIRTEMAATMATLRDSHGRADQAETQAIAETARADAAEARLAAAEAALADARTPWAIRLLKAWRRQA
jgi:hypothetical protein